MHRLFLPLAILLVVACLTLPLLGCATTAGPGPRVPIDPPPEPPAAAVCAPLEAEPLPPAGVDRDALYAGMIAALGPKAEAWLQWQEAEWPAWARRGWRRLDEAHRACSL